MLLQKRQNLKHMSLKQSLKSIAESSPYGIGSKLALVPFSIRLGSQYLAFKKQINNGIEPEPYIIKHFSEIFGYAKNKFPFYKELYKSAGVYDLKIKNIQDIQKLPIITKEDIREHSSQFKGAMRLNTGGTSGEPFNFFVDKHAFAREWAHMHTIWEIKGYKYRDLKITLRGKNLGEKSWRYNPVHNEFIINTYTNASRIRKDILQLFQKHDIKYIHGYPSAIYNFFQELYSVVTEEEKAIITKNIKACFLGSEFPTPQITECLESRWGLDYISWYGHSEMCILAYDEFKKNEYKPFMTYGYAEAVENRLIGTSFHNFDMPLIRYDTGDLVNPSFDKYGLLSNFKITQGRKGDYILDRHSKAIPLTALIFGRHHKVFDYARFVQVQQSEPGKLTFFVTTNEQDCQKIFQDIDMSNVDIEYNIRILSEPIKTPSGKVNLKIQS